jgi:hypothetical protein
LITNFKKPTKSFKQANKFKGSRTGRGFSGYAGQLRGIYLCGREIQLAQLVRKLNPHGIQIGDMGFCRINTCVNDAKCMEFYDQYKCNCSLTPFGGPKCDQGRFFKLISLREKSKLED